MFANPGNATPGNPNRNMMPPQQQLQQQVCQPVQLQMPQGGSDGDQWTCLKCGNLNYQSRIFCNMRKCGAPRSEENWRCPGCGNENYASRLFCNMRKCQLARPGLSASALHQQRFGPGAKGGGKMGGAGGMMNGMMGNYGNNMMMMQQMMGAQMVGKPPPGSWMCTACNNINFPNRTHCNKKTCGQARAAVDGGYPGSANAGAAPPGSWVCRHCSNVNWPDRTVCNSKKCGQPKPV
eukprot:gnl/TRDRNA2_/TRDRNA2_86616_c0_seq2.p1 gnl/TRDRNA2_/TRDRNA2_86616_c0~~gnl/TRDRNA2_/TRDRNA2_86616_c0_seq2.p1  ORF type:complete len:236 (+),score=39.34 gnl/TRDRNA2_/TRDRNA2_86616_c0_seq2:106-813(+)